MKLRNRGFMSGILLLIFTSIALANSAPRVSNVTASQRNDDSKLGDIYYNLSDADNDACTIWVAISEDNGVSWKMPAMTFTGAIGKNIFPGSSKHVVWDAGKDMDGKVATFKARVSAASNHLCSFTTINHFQK